MRAQVYIFLAYSYYSLPWGLQSLPLKQGEGEGRGGDEGEGQSALLRSSAPTRAVHSRRLTAGRFQTAQTRSPLILVTYCWEHMKAGLESGFGIVSINPANMEPEKGPGYRLLSSLKGHLSFSLSVFWSVVFWAPGREAKVLKPKEERTFEAQNCDRHAGLTLGQACGAFPKLRTLVLSIVPVLVSFAPTS